MNYFDCHADTLTNMPAGAETLGENQCNVDLKRARSFAEKYTQIFAVWKDFREMNRSHLEEKFLQIYKRAADLLRAEEYQLAWCTTGEEMEQAHKEGKTAVFLSIEDLSIMGEEALHIRELGFRFAMLTWNYNNQYACGAAADQTRGLTERGREMVKLLLDREIVLDISHLSDAGAEELFGITDRPLMASHSNARDVCGHPRNLKKEQIQELIRRKGLMGINLFSPFIGQEPKLSDVLRHMDYILELGGEEILALGCDLDGSSNRFPKGFIGVESMPGLWELMEKEGFGRPLTERIFFENAREFILKNVR